MLAARRNDSVNGRTIILVVSMRTKNGFNQSGAPSGKKWAIDDIGALENVDIIILSHSGRPNLIVKIKCLESLNMYGIRPKRLIKMIIEKSGATIDLIPFKLNMYVRAS
jgi:hypothetical protein